MDDSLLNQENDDVDETDSKYLSFPLGESLYGIDIHHVLEVVIRNTNTRITKVPHMPAYTKGVINLRGKVIPVIDLRLRFRMDEIE
ncbi:MAG: chemotaxis protein CheW, partial [SAR324 cluster bacterium]|nr:chemotaxis protein CheW [SAR324 cluster bacterium]